MLPKIEVGVEIYCLNSIIEWTIVDDIYINEDGNTRIVYRNYFPHRNNGEEVEMNKSKDEFTSWLEDASVAKISRR